MAGGGWEGSSHRSRSAPEDLPNDVLGHQQGSPQVQYWPQKQASLLKLISPYGKIISEDFLWHMRSPKPGEPHEVFD
ncbi:hypothetical protein JHK87_022531 [Glycine soja]|nr:hypothetical protein JHK87_022531 [Glycine soja]